MKTKDINAVLREIAADPKVKTLHFDSKSSLRIGTPRTQETKCKLSASLKRQGSTISARLKAEWKANPNRIADVGKWNIKKPALHEIGCYRAAIDSVKQGASMRSAAIAHHGDTDFWRFYRRLQIYVAGQRLEELK
jgi:hypothetical protein